MDEQNSVREFSDELAYLLGVIGGDGTIYIKQKQQYLVTISDKEHEYHQRVLKPLFEEVFRYRPSIEFSEKRNSWYTVIRSKEIAMAIAEWFSAGRSKTYDDKIPREIVLSNESRVLLPHLAGWLDSEGTSKVKTIRTKYGEYKYPEVRIELVNKSFVELLYGIGRKLGITSTKPMLAKRNYRNRKPCIAYLGMDSKNVLDLKK